MGRDVTAVHTSASITCGETRVSARESVTRRGQPHKTDAAAASPSCLQPERSTHVSCDAMDVSTSATAASDTRRQRRSESADKARQWRGNVLSASSTVG
eukprot:3032405-Pleurochrysis_carterae.AAC.1